MALGLRGLDIPVTQIRALVRREKKQQHSA
jgi:hypothetical protein